MEVRRLKERVVDAKEHVKTRLCGRGEEWAGSGAGRERVLIQVHANTLHMCQTT